MGAGVLGGLIAGLLDYSSLKTLHIAGAVAFLGNIIITGWWKAMADRTRNVQTIAYAQRQVTVTDWIFTFGGIITILLTGYGMTAHMGDEIWQERWLQWGYALFVASGVIWVFILIPVQIIQARMAKRFTKGGDIPDRYWTLGKIWLVFGVTATILPIINIYWMTFKP